ncbi:MAG: restriction endonuclease subunit S [Betaproteobacteria bacterium]|nr:restriction endonuclease subunit S [Betaproteobacteria bacterium]
MSAIPAGYKQSEVGVIPDDWDVKAIGDGIDLLTGFPFPSSGYSASGVRLLRGSNVKRGQTDWAEEITQYWPAITQDIARYELREGDLVIAMDGSLVGRSSAKLAENDMPALLLQRVARIRSTKKLDTGYLAAFVGSDWFVKHADSVKTVTAIPHISPADIASFAIPVPPTIDEQRAISAALSDVDALLEKLDQLIAKKRDLKQAAMQQLLTGQIRLPGFSGAWEVKRLGDVLRVRHGKSQHNVVTQDGQYPILATGGEIGRSNTFLYDKPSVLIGRKGTIDKPQFRDEPFWTVDTLFYTEIAGANSPKFLFYMFNMIDWRSYNEASGVPSLNATTIENIDVKVPLSEEQTAIATVLSDMDAELTALEARRDKTRALKQGMMQELLTGRIRLV